MSKLDKRFELKVGSYIDEDNKEFFAVRVTYAGMVVVSKLIQKDDLPKRPSGTNR